METFSIFIVVWCIAAFLFPIASVSSIREKETVEEITVSEEQTIFLDDFYGKEVFRLPGNYSDQQILEHNGKIYLLYFDYAEEKQVFMKVKEVEQDSKN